MSRLPLIAHALLALTVAATAAAQDDELDRVKETLADIIADNTTNAEVFDTNGFRVEASRNEELGANLRPDGARFEGLNISADGVFRVAVVKGRPMSTGGGLAIFHRDSGQPILSVGDSNGDGALDGLSYAVVDKDGQATLEVIDYEADGQADMKIHFVDHYSELWHADRWYRIEKREGRRGIVLDGVFVEVKNENNRLVVP